VNLSRLTASIESLRITGPKTGQESLSPDPDITSVHYNSKDVKPGGLFVAVQGLKADGHRFIPDALSRGASAIVAEQDISGTDAPVIRVTNSRKALALVSACFYDHPSLGMHITGVTGTNGKTSITYFLESMFKEAGFIPGVIGTINCRYAGNVIDNPMTTPDSLDLQRLLADMKKAGVTHVVMEVSSHAVDLDRILGITFDTGVFTNLSQDHLDYHGTMEDYFACKKRFFTEYLSNSDSPKKQTSVINTADPEGCRLVGDIAGSVLTTGLPDADIRIENPQLDLKGIKGALVTPRGRIDIRSRVIGRSEEHTSELSHNSESRMPSSA
jgi:UDP-N-acetylmuramyl-tripeptide synthetase